MYKFLKTVFFVLNPKNRKNLTKEQKEIALYIIFGVLTTAVSFASYFLFRRILPYENTSVPVVLAWVCAVTFAYFTNKIWVFGSRRDNFGSVIREFMLFYAARLSTLGVDLLMMFLMVDLPGIKNAVYEFFARVLVSAVVLALNYILSKKIVFNKKNT